MREEKNRLAAELDKRHDENDNLRKEVEKLGRTLEVKSKDLSEAENCVSKNSAQGKREDHREFSSSRNKPC